jgi:hypothetical protein
MSKMMDRQAAMEAFGAHITTEAFGAKQGLNSLWAQFKRSEARAREEVLAGRKLAAEARAAYKQADKLHKEGARAKALYQRDRAMHQRDRATALFAEAERLRAHASGLSDASGRHGTSASEHDWNAARLYRAYKSGGGKRVSVAERERGTVSRMPLNVYLR